MSYCTAFCIAQSKKPHTIGEEVIKFCLIEATFLSLAKRSNKLKETSLSINAIKNRVSEMSDDILLQVVKDLRSSSQISLQFDESTDVSSCVELLVYARYSTSLEIKYKSNVCFQNPFQPCVEKKMFSKL